LLQEKGDEHMNVADEFRDALSKADGEDAVEVRLVYATLKTVEGFAGQLFEVHILRSEEPSYDVRPHGGGETGEQPVGSGPTLRQAVLDYRQKCVRERRA
jgi:hypothetical protein